MSQLSLLCQTINMYMLFFILKSVGRDDGILNVFLFRLFPVSSSSENEPKGKDYLHPFHRTITVRRGVLAEESADLMQMFFAMRRLGVKSAPWPRSLGGWLPSGFKKLNPCVQRRFRFWVTILCSLDSSFQKVILAQFGGRRVLSYFDQSCPWIPSPTPIYSYSTLHPSEVWNGFAPWSKYCHTVLQLAVSSCGYSVPKHLYLFYKQTVHRTPLRENLTEGKVTALPIPSQRNVHV